MLLVNDEAEAGQFTVHLGDTVHEPPLQIAAAFLEQSLHVAHGRDTAATENVNVGFTVPVIVQSTR